jgi:SNF2 family DNA or RNA helicase
MWNIAAISGSPQAAGHTPGGIAVTVRVPGGAMAETGREPPVDAGGLDALWLRVEHARLRLLRGFEELLCLEGVHGLERLPHQIETVRRVLRHFRGGVLLADEVGLGKTIEAGLLLREYLLRGMIKRVLILVPPSLVSQWHEELSTKFALDFTTAEGGQNIKDRFWQETDRVLASLALAKSTRHFEAVSACAWDLVVVDEAHHCRNRATRNWQLVNALQRRRMLLLTATPVQNDLLELYNLLTLLEPGHLKTEADFKRNYVRRGNPRDPRNRERLRELLGQVMIRNTRSLVSVDLPPRYAQTFVIQPDAQERELYRLLDAYLRWRTGGCPATATAELLPEEGSTRAGAVQPEDETTLLAERAASPTGESGQSAAPTQLNLFDERAAHNSHIPKAHLAHSPTERAAPELPRRRIASLLMAAGSHPAALAAPLAELAGQDERIGPLLELARRSAGSTGNGSGRPLSAKEAKLIELLRANRQGKALVFANFAATLDRLAGVLRDAGIRYSVFTGRQTAAEKAQAVELLASEVPVMLCSEIGGEGHNLQFANTLINFDLPWNPMRIEQRVGRIHRIGQTREVFIFNLCTAGSLEERVLRLLHEKIRMFELVVGEVGSILGNLEGGDEFESLVLNLWLQSRGPADLDQGFEQLGDSLLAAQEGYLKTKRLDTALFGDEYE